MRIRNKTTNMIYKNLEGKVVMITGASSGLGEVLAKKFAENKCTVYLGARSLDKLQNIVNDLRIKGHDAYYFSLDVTDPKQVEQIAHNIIEREDKIDIWVNNAGWSKKASIFELTPELLDEVTRVNYYGLVYGTIEAAKCMKNLGGDIVQILSGSAYTPRPEQPAYAGSKAAATMFSDSVKDELKKHGIRITKILPGAMNTEFAEKSGNTLPQNLIEPEDVADVVLNILSKPRTVGVEARIYRNV